MTLREAEKELSHKRETLIRTEALCERHQTEQDSLIQRIKDKLDCTPDQLPELAQLGPSEKLTESLEKLEFTVNRLLNERDQIGPVNLHACPLASANFPDQPQIPH